LSKASSRSPALARKSMSAYPGIWFGEPPVRLSVRDGGAVASAIFTYRAAKGPCGRAPLAVWVRLEPLLHSVPALLLESVIAQKAILRDASAVNDSFVERHSCDMALTHCRQIASAAFLVAKASNKVDLVAWTHTPVFEFLLGQRPSGPVKRAKPMVSC